MKIKKILSMSLMSLTFLCSNSDSIATDTTGVIFNIQIDKKIMANKGYLNIRILNDEQLKISKNSANCIISFNVETKKEAVTCPPGVTYKKVVPEIFTFNIAKIKDIIVIKSNSVKIGQQYSLDVSGPSKDNCNTTSASVEKTADSAQENIKNLQWLSTLMGCANVLY